MTLTRCTFWKCADVCLQSAAGSHGVRMKLIVTTLLITNVIIISASPYGAYLARQRGHLLLQAKRWAPTEIRMNEFIHKIRSRFNSQSATSYERRAIRADPSKGAVGKMLRRSLMSKKPNKGPPPVKMYRLRTRFGRIPSPVNLGGKK